MSQGALDRIPPIASEFLIVGEGQGDSAFIRHLCGVRGISIDNFQIEDAGGTGKFEAYIAGLSIRPQFDRVKGILIVGDNDDSPDTNFRNVSTYLKKGKLPRPARPLQSVRQNQDGPLVTVMMLPFTNDGGATRGSLETLLLRSVELSNPAVWACIDTYRNCIPAQGRTKNQEDKFRLRCYLSAMWKDEPNISLQYAVAPSKNLIDLTHACFNEIADLLNRFTSLRANQ